MASNFINQDRFIVNEQFAIVKNTYEIQDVTGRVIGHIKERRPGWHIFASLFINKHLLPFHLDILDENNNLLATVERGFTFFSSTVKVYDAKHFPVGTLQQKIFSLRPKFILLDAYNRQVGLLKGSFMAWDFMVTDNEEQVIGMINKKFNGLVNELFTTKDRYVVFIPPFVTDTKVRTLVASIACVIDLIYKE